jgi:hypothetical protein
MPSASGRVDHLAGVAHGADRGEPVSAIPYAHGASGRCIQRQSGSTSDWHFLHVATPLPGDPSRQLLVRRAGDLEHDGDDHGGASALKDRASSGPGQPFIGSLLSIRAAASLSGGSRAGNGQKAVGAESSTPLSARLGSGTLI